MDDLDDFEFGEMPEDDDVTGREEYDTNNDDTFGADIVSDFDHPDLSNYAEQTNVLGKQFDELWRVPGRSTDAPDASNLPMPSSIFDETPFSSLKDNPWDSGSNGLFNLWSSGGGVHDKSIVDNDDTDYILKYMEEVHAARSQQQDKNENQSRQPYPPLRPSDVKNDAVHRAFNSERKIEQHDAHQGASTNKPLSAAELEQQFIEEARRKNENEQPAMHPTLLAMFQSHDSTVMRKPQMMSPQMHTPPLRQPSLDRPYPQMNGPSHPMPNQPPPSGQPPPWAMAIPPQFHKFIPVWFEYACRRIPHLPQGVPPVHPVIIQVLNAQRQASMNRGHVPPPGFNGMPPPPMMGPPGMYGMNPMQRMHPSMQQPDSWRNRPSSSMSSMSHRKPPGFPTGKTIEDFAFDPYAGFMSKKEREWLIKIQLLQCLGSGNPYLEDYYYTLWSQKRARDTDSVNGDDIHEETKKRKEKLVPRNYNAPKFSGSLGKPVSSTTSNPRHLIDVSVHVDSPDDESKKASSRKLKTVLLIVENSVLALLQCEDKMRHPTPSSESEIEEKMEVLMTHVFTSSMVSKIVNIPKGRRLITQFMNIAPIRYQLRALLAFIESGSRLTANGRASTEVMGAIGEEVIPHLLHSMVQWSREELIELSKHLSADTILNDLKAKNAITRDILLSYLYACSALRAHSSSSIFAFLKGTTSIEWNSFAPASSMWIKNCKLNKNKVEVFVEWLRLLSHGTTHVAAQLANSILV